MPDHKIRLEIMIQKMREKGLRITPQRIAILRVLSISKGHPSVENIYEQVKEEFPTTSVATVYKNVSMLKELGEVLELNFGTESSRYDGNKPNPHPHLICTECKKIIDPDLDSLKDMSTELIKETGFRITSHRLDFFGICPECQAK
ncbi:MAG: Fur family transcriptional regulator [Desulfobacteraceae bacterium]